MFVLTQQQSLKVGWICLLEVIWSCPFPFFSLRNYFLQLWMNLLAEITNCALSSPLSSSLPKGKLLSMWISSFRSWRGFVNFIVICFIAILDVKDRSNSWKMHPTFAWCYFFTAKHFCLHTNWGWANRTWTPEQNCHWFNRSYFLFCFLAWIRESSLPTDFWSYI